MWDYRFGCLFNTYLLPMALSIDVTGDEAKRLGARVVGGLLQNLIDHRADKLLDELEA
jgi:hypothetical protein